MKPTITLAPAAALGLLFALATSSSAPPDPAKAYAPEIAPASGEATLSMKQIQLPPGFQVSLFAAEPMLANPVSFCIDEHNRFFVAETFRHGAGVTDTRDHMDWLDDDLASRTVEDRVSLLKKHLGPKSAKWTIEHERVRMLEDTKSQGRADRSTVFADGFHHLEDGIGAGLLARRGRVWYTCIPDLWLLRDTKGTGQANQRTRLHHGFGVHIAFLGHDLHGLRFGPDGKLYFSIGDRGLHVLTGSQTVSCPDTGAVLRCDPNGSNLELFATGLRNPQELAFDEYGNLFTGDNNADHGDKARWVYLVEGGDSGWRESYQYVQRPVDLGPWNAEKLWLPHRDGQAAYIVPPIANVADGPAGLAYYPGTGLPDRYRGHFFLCDFRGASNMSGIRSFAVKPKGASFEFVDQHQFIWSVLATDVDFGADSALYILDWVEGWNKPKRGRIYKVTNPARDSDHAVAEVKKLLAEGMERRSIDELARLLEHKDMRIRQEAQFALAERGSAAIPVLTAISQDNTNRLARLHAIWGLGQIGREVPAAFAPLPALLSDADVEVRCQTARVLGDGAVASAGERLTALLNDRETRVRFFAAQALGKLGRTESVPAVLEMLRANHDQDAYLRHAGVIALSHMPDRSVLHAAIVDRSAAVRLAALLVLRRWQSPDVAHFLEDPEPRLVLEAARAIYDVPIPQGMPKLAALAGRVELPEPLWDRVLNANFRLGGADHARAVAEVAGRSSVPTSARIEALRELADWATPSGRDRIMGLWRPLQPRPLEQAAEALRTVLRQVFDGPSSLRSEAARSVARLHVSEASPYLLKNLSNDQPEVEVRLEALKALDALNDRRLTEALALARADTNPRVRMQGFRILARSRPNEALAALDTLLEKGVVIEQQASLSIVGEIPGPAADAVLDRWLDKLLAGKVRPEIQLELLAAATPRRAPGIQEKLALYEVTRAQGDSLARYRESLAGGDPQAGKDIFQSKAEVSCQRCHKVRGEGGEVGPDLTGIGSRQKREYLLESIVVPNKDIAKGFETVVLGMTNGQVHTGIIKSEDAREVRLITAEGKLLAVPKDQIEDRLRGKSAMPEDIIQHLTKRELRDLVEFLVELK